MQFVNSNAPPTYFKYIQQTQRMNSPGTFVMPMRQSVAKPNAQPVDNQQVVVSVKKMRWGEPTWFLFHTLAHKLKDESFELKKMDLLNVISTICSNLPCPDCANHASEYMKNINFYAIKTKHDLKKLLFQFHNVVRIPLLRYRQKNPLFVQP